jgi:protein-S-isoprenylcysteine O-methyltransferase Ste14
MTTKDKVLMTIESIGFVVQVVLCFFFYNHLGFSIVLYLGWALFLIAMILGWQAHVALEKEGEAREGERWIQTRALVSSGIYGVARHPMYLSFMMISLGLVLVSQYWLNLIIGIIVMIIIYSDMYREEMGTLEKLGDEYLNYMEQVPRMNLIEGVIRQNQRRK